MCISEGMYIDGMSHKYTRVYCVVFVIFSLLLQAGTLDLFTNIRQGSYSDAGIIVLQKMKNKNENDVKM